MHHAAAKSKTNIPFPALHVPTNSSASRASPAPAKTGFYPSPDADGVFLSCLLAPASRVSHTGSATQLITGRVLVYPPRAV